MAHSTPSDPHRDEIAELLRLAGPRELPAPDAADRIRLASREEWRDAVRLRRRRRRLVWGGASLAAAAALVVVIQRSTMFEGPRIVQPVVTIATVERVTGEATVGASRNRLTEPLASGRQILSGSTVRTGANGYLGLRLASGASVRVDAGTAVEFGSRNVLALERGAIYIDTDDAGPAAAVEVRTPLATARDIGTRFEVRLVASAVRVRVRGGLVRVDQRGAAYDAAPGIELIASAGILERRTVPLHGPDWDWTLRVSPPFAIEGRTLASFLQWVEREGGWHPRFSDPELERSSSSVVLHGSIDGLTPADALAVVLPTCGLTHRVDGDVLRLQRQ